MNLYTNWLVVINIEFIGKQVHQLTCSYCSRSYMDYVYQYMARQNQYVFNSTPY